MEIVLVPFSSMILSFPSRHTFRGNSSGAISYQRLYISTVGRISVEIVLVPFLSMFLSFPSRHNFRENGSGAISYQCLYVSTVGIFSA